MSGCALCGKPTKHAVNRNSDRIPLCCQHWVEAGFPPGDDHEECLSAEASVEIDKHSGRRIVRHNDKMFLGLREPVADAEC